jgi:hypothetical protein
MIATILPACECGADEHAGLTHEVALEIEAARCTPGCTCPGYEGAPEGLHDGLCDLADDDYRAWCVGSTLLEDAHRLQPTVKAFGALHPREMPEPPEGCEMGGPGSCKACQAPTGFHCWWCAMRGASAREIAALRTTGGGS